MTEELGGFAVGDVDPMLGFHSRYDQFQIRTSLNWFGLDIQGIAP